MLSYLVSYPPPRSLHLFLTRIAPTLPSRVRIICSRNQERRPETTVLGLDQGIANLLRWFAGFSKTADSSTLWVQAVRSYSAPQCQSQVSWKPGANVGSARTTYRPTGPFVHGWSLYPHDAHTNRRIAEYQPSQSYVVPRGRYFEHPWGTRDIEMDLLGRVRCLRWEK